VKYILLPIFLTISPLNYAKEPQYMKGQCVQIKLPKFHSKVCKDVALIKDYTLVNNKILYYIRLYNKYSKAGCSNLNIEESNVIEVLKDDFCYE